MCLFVKKILCDPAEARTLDPQIKSLLLYQLSYGVIFVTRPGFEPRQTESESVVLPLYYRAIGVQRYGELMAKRGMFWILKIFFALMLRRKNLDPDSVIL